MFGPLYHWLLSVLGVMIIVDLLVLTLLPFVIYLFYGVVHAYLFEFCNHLAEEEKAGCFALIVLLMSYGCL